MDNGLNDTALMVFALAAGITLMVGLLYIHIYDPGLNDAMYSLRSIILNVVQPSAIKPSSSGAVDVMPH